MIQMSAKRGKPTVYEMNGSAVSPLDLVAAWMHHKGEQMPALSVEKQEMYEKRLESFKSTARLYTFLKWFYEKYSKDSKPETSGKQLSFSFDELEKQAEETAQEPEAQEPSPAPYPEPVPAVQKGKGKKA